MADHPKKVAAALCDSPKLAAHASGFSIEACRAMRDKRSARYTESQRRDPLINAAATRRWRTPSALAARAAENAARLAAIQADIDRVKNQQARDEATRVSLLLAARAARALGFVVRSSKNRSGHISSYYCQRGGATLRISDHDIPSTLRRDYIAQTHGRAYHDGYHGQQLIVDQPRRYEWLRRAVILAAAGRI